VSGIGRRYGQSVVAEPKSGWLITGSCGWERTASSAWAATAIARLHAQLLLDMNDEHTIAIEEPPTRPGLAPRIQRYGFHIP
jgi:hypothetical protein